MLPLSPPEYEAGTSERHHGPFPAGRVPLSPAEMWCPRGESPVIYMPAITGELVLEGSTVSAAADLWIRRVTIGCVALLALIAGTVLVPPGITSPHQDIAR